MRLLVDSKNTPPDDQVSENPRNPNKSAQPIGKIPETQRIGRTISRIRPPNWAGVVDVHNRPRLHKKPSVRAQYACYLPQMQLPRSHVGSTGGSIQKRSHVSWGLPDRQANEEAMRWDSMRPALRCGCAVVDVGGHLRLTPPLIPKASLSHDHTTVVIGQPVSRTEQPVKSVLLVVKQASMTSIITTEQSRLPADGQSRLLPLDGHRRILCGVCAGLDIIHWSSVWTEAKGG